MQNSGNKTSPGQLKIVLQSTKKAGTNSCELFFKIENKTSINITSLNFTTTFRGDSDVILGKNYLQIKKVPVNVKVDERQYAMVISCSDIKKLKLNPLELLFVEGKSRRDLIESIENVIVTSSMTSIKFNK